MGTQVVGNDTCGTVQVPSNWENRVTDYDKDIAEDTEMVYYCDPDSEYASKTFGHFMFARAIQLRYYPASYRQVSRQVLESYDDENYDEVDSEETTFNGLDCFVINARVKDDNLDVRNIVIDRENQGETTILLTLQGTPSTVDTVSEYASSWVSPDAQ